MLQKFGTVFGRINSFWFVAIILVTSTAMRPVNGLAQEHRPPFDFEKVYAAAYCMGVIAVHAEPWAQKTRSAVCFPHPDRCDSIAAQLYADEWNRALRLHKRYSDFTKLALNHGSLFNQARVDLMRNIPIIVEKGRREAASRRDEKRIASQNCWVSCRTRVQGQIVKPMTDPELSKISACSNKCLTQMEPEEAALERCFEGAVVMPF